MKKSPYWIQAPDFSGKEYDAVGENDAIKAFKENNWKELEKIRDLREKENEEYCDPGMGIVPGDGRILHIALAQGNEFYIHYHYQKKGLFGSTSKTKSIMSVDISDVPRYVEHIYRDEHESLLK